MWDEPKVNTERGKLRKEITCQLPTQFKDILKDKKNLFKPPSNYIWLMVGVLRTDVYRLCKHSCRLDSLAEKWWTKIFQSWWTLNLSPPRTNWVDVLLHRINFQFNSTVAGSLVGSHPAVVCGRLWI
ncbi:hypothetical protein O6H91_04G033100 [Diphasiastrum complanatum]|uniref:Uncharacterized protein n=1 Tax=Diphasiastrum complanatum TaxID=34168 RepID=A0ACC2DVN2_DIPCM|nr:hypothetical protein O6H91_04G033100 [Diphasiastrum complanatum]